MHLKGCCILPHLSLSFEVGGFFSVSCPRCSPLRVSAFDIPLPEYLHPSMPFSHLPGLSVRLSLLREAQTLNPTLYHWCLFFVSQEVTPPKAVIFIELFTPSLSVPLPTMKAATLLWLLANVSLVPSEVLVHSTCSSNGYIHTEHVCT